MCGGTPRLRPRLGLSPRVRGNPTASTTGLTTPWSIPACAGEPDGQHDRPHYALVYPRVCGGTGIIGADPIIESGLSPRVRGNRWSCPRRQPRCRSIPACAGEPLSIWHCQEYPWVYPRVCGGTVGLARADSRDVGLSPRVRGNLCPFGTVRNIRGSIPACAGEPLVLPAPTAAMSVYPRVCGGTAGPVNRFTSGNGLSPRVRGNPTEPPQQWAVLRSIPACAGEPAHRHGTGRSCWVYPACAGEPELGHIQTLATMVYPRVCGGTPRLLLRIRADIGLSPRVRGNRRRRVPRCDRQGSIPACAGEPSKKAKAAGWPGSIPACAGEPPRCSDRTRRGRVYPRVCGGTMAMVTPVTSMRGLSPRVRGNRQEYAAGPVSGGSIPACAGEPWRRRRSWPACRVYPRVCGGTPPPAVLQPPLQGLSPRVRGNPRLPARRRAGGRSIPACAGEPRLSDNRRRVEVVYPRVCGGTRASVGI